MVPQMMQGPGDALLRIDIRGKCTCDRDNSHAAKKLLPSPEGKLLYFKWACLERHRSASERQSVRPERA
jgi:hypothetical protein